MRTSTLLRYAQDVAWRHSEALGFDRDWYRERGLGWVVRAVELELHAAVPMGHTLRVTTAVVGHRRIWARRLGECRLADGPLAARVDHRLGPARRPQPDRPDPRRLRRRVREPRGRTSEILRVPAPAGPVASALTLAVRPRDLDPLDHVNNAVYVDWLEEALDAAGWRPVVRQAPDMPARVPRLGGPRRRGRCRAPRTPPPGTRESAGPTAWSSSAPRRPGGDIVSAAGEDDRG